MRLRSTAPLALAALVTGLVASRTAAQSETQSRDQNYFALKLMLGFAGSVDASNGNVSLNGDAETSYGGGAAYMLPLQRYFVLGGQLALQSWQSKNGSNGNASRDLMADLTLVPQARLPLSRDVELYVSLPIGASLDFLNEVGVNVAGAVNVDADPALGFTLSILGGARFALTDSFGLLAEAGYSLHSFSHDINVQTPVVGVSGGNLDLDIGYFALHAGVWF